MAFVPIVKEIIWIPVGVSLASPTLVLITDGENVSVAEYMDDFWSPKLLVKGKKKDFVPTYWASLHSIETPTYGR